MTGDICLHLTVCIDVLCLTDTWYLHCYFVRTTHTFTHTLIYIIVSLIFLFIIIVTWQLFIWPTHYTLYIVLMYSLTHIVFYSPTFVVPHIDLHDDDDDQECPLCWDGGAWCWWWWSDDVNGRLMVLLRLRYWWCLIDVVWGRMTRRMGGCVFAGREEMCVLVLLWDIWCWWPQRNMYSNDELWKRQPTVWPACQCNLLNSLLSSMASMPAFFNCITHIPVKSWRSYDAGVCMPYGYGCG